MIFDVDSIAAPAMAGVAAATEGLANVKLQRLISGDEVSAVRQKRIELQKAYRPPGQ